MGTLASAITQLENTNPKYNNPGAISGTGDTGTFFGQGIGVYSTPQAGEAAFEKQISSIYSGASPLYPGGSSLTLDQFGNIYAPGQNYGSSLASELHVPSNTPLSQIPSGLPGTPSNTNSPSPTGIIASINKGIDYLNARADAKDASKTNWLEDITIIVVGIILIAAGVFSFKQSQTVIQTGTKAVKKIAEVAA